jgi:hypothetical protein
MFFKSKNKYMREFNETLFQNICFANQTGF